MRTEEQEWQDLEKKLKPKTVDCRTGVCKYRQRMVGMFRNFFKKTCKNKNNSNTKYKYKT